MGRRDRGVRRQLRRAWRERGRSISAGSNPRVPPGAVVRRLRDRDRGSRRGRSSTTSGEPEPDGTAVGWTESIAVRKPYRRRGIASAMLAESLRIVRDAGAARAALGVDQQNPNEAQTLYERLGFRVTLEELEYQRPRATSRGPTRWPDGSSIDPATEAAARGARLGRTVRGALRRARRAGPRARSRHRQPSRDIDRPARQRRCLGRRVRALPPRCPGPRRLPGGR